MIRSIYLVGFKNYRDVEVDLGPFTVVLGANAAGKSNLRDACRFLHGLSRGYTLAETIGEKYGEGGTRQWTGIRGGTREATYQGQSALTIAVSLDVELRGRLAPAVYGIGVDVSGAAPRVEFEQLYPPDSARPYFDTEPGGQPIGSDTHHIWAQVRQRKSGRDPVRQFLSD